jgi:hypothetical protein
MLKKALLLIVVCLLPILMSCDSGTSAVTQPSQVAQATPEQTQETTPEPTNTVPPTPTFVVENNEISVSIGTPVAGGEMRADGYQNIDEGFYLYGGTVVPEDTDGNAVELWAGFSGSAPLTIVNGNDYARTFHLSIQSPSVDGYLPFPEKYYSWVSIEDLTPKVAIGGSRRISITLSVPYQLPNEIRGNKFTFGILVEDWSQTGFVQIAYQQKWLVSFVR